MKISSHRLTELFLIAAIVVLIAALGFYGWLLIGFGNDARKLESVMFYTFLILVFSIAVASFGYYRKRGSKK